MLVLVLLPSVCGCARGCRCSAELGARRLMFVPCWGLLRPQCHLRRNGLSIWNSVALGVAVPGWAPGQPWLPMALGGHRSALSWGSLPAGTAPKDHVKPTLFRNKDYCLHNTRSPGACLAWPWKKPSGKINKSNHEACREGCCVCQGDLGTGHSCSRGSWGHCLWHRGKEGWGESANVAASRNAPSYGGWCNLM